MADPHPLIDDRYQLSHQLGEGTFGQVWRAEDLRLSRRAVAIKFLKPEFLSHREAVARFESEADALAQVQHPNVVSIYDRGQWNGRHYLVTEFVKGRSLGAWLDEHRTQRKYPDIAATLKLFDQICAGVEAAHLVRAPGPIVHRDLKPDNLLVRVQPNGEPLVKVVDFGIAQLGGRSGTRTGVSMGTPLYMAPEQALGDTAGVGPWTDVFALGIILVEMLTLRAQAEDTRPWCGTATQRATEIPALLRAMRPDVPASVWDATARALQPRGTDRHPHAGALRSALRDCVTQPPARERPPTTRTSRARAEEIPTGGGFFSQLSSLVLGHRGAKIVSRTAIALVVLAMLAYGLLYVQPSLTDPATTPDGLPTTPRGDQPVVPAVVAPQPATTLPLMVAAMQPLPDGRGVNADLALSQYFHRWSRAVITSRGTEVLDAFYAESVQFRGSGRSSDAVAIRHYYAAAFAHEYSFAIDWNRSQWILEDVNSPDASSNCRTVAGATGAIVKVRAWATEFDRDRGDITGGEVPCDRLEGRYLFRLRQVGPALRICHETWSLREGVCASCPAARQCQGVGP